MADLLVIDDDPSMARAFELFLSREGHQFRVAGSAEEGLRLLAERTPDLVFLDVRMPGLDGLQALPIIRERWPETDVVIMTAYGSSQTSIDAMRAGAFDLLVKPLDLDHLRATIRRVLDAQRVRSQLADRPAPTEESAAGLVGDSAAMHAVFKMIGRLATVDVPALVVGERGTGKRVVVAAIHANSARRDQPLTVIDCASSSGDELDALIGGRLSGTVQLANVEALALRDQARVVSALRAGGTPAPARVVASTELDLAPLVAQGDFSRELFEALGIVTLHLPPLRERRDDIPVLVDVLLQRLSVEVGRTIRGVDPQVEERFREHPWRANIIELANVLRRAAILGATDVITLADLGDSLASQPPAPRAGLSDLARAAKAALHERLSTGVSPAQSVYHSVVGEVEEVLVQEALEMTGGNQVKAADLLGVNRTTLRKRAPGAK